ncbi:MAG TPA: threonine-phosphate decarboxylase CobD [Candidatus Angelobacter sp.]|nr:threonine-phosphate decarboxylase CobD [Candidatus Angelobacter sp.]
MISTPKGSLEEGLTHIGTAEHGGAVWMANGQRSRSMDFSANIWPYPMDVSKFSEWISHLDAYPDPDCRALVSAAAAHYGVEPGQIFAANGSTEALYLAMLTLRPKKVAIFEPTFSEYERAAQWATASTVEVVRIQAYPKADFVPALRVPNADVAILCNPNNPTGVYLPREVLGTWLDACAAANVFVVMDEAFIEFVEDEAASMADELATRSNLLILRSMTKFFGIPGIRLGFALGAAGFIRKIWQNRIPWSVNVIAQQMGTYLAQDSISQAGVAARVACERLFLSQGFERLGCTVLPSTANFILCKLPHGQSNRDLLSRLSEKGFLLRDAANFHGLNGEYVRCAVKERPENDALLKAIAECW